ncbi:MAG: ribbon-helix-helix domain-containing protein [Leptolyngbyaceae cyanobacterium MO_188.B28]|nr:ribbon-helix-helix domain-containing protein [Leptolyngbyaceae cyanobacterium MO_188.B28]
MAQKQLNIRIPEHELKILARYARKTKRTKTDIIREFIRSLKTQNNSSLQQTSNVERSITCGGATKT